MATGERQRKRRLNSWRVICFTGILGVLYLLALVIRIRLAGQQDDVTRATPPADVIIVLGAAQANGRPMGVLQGRLDHAFTLYQQGHARYLLFTGGRQPGDNYTEAGAGRREARRRGVPEQAILLEPHGRTTMQSLQACTEIMRRHHLHRAILVSDPFHAFRLRRMAHDLGMEALVSPTPHSRVRSLRKQLQFTVREVGVYTAYRLLGV